MGIKRKMGKIKRKKNLISVFVIVSLAALILVQVVLAADYYRLPNGLVLDITEHTVCKTVENNSGKDIFIPTKTSTEWSEFRTHYPTGVVLTVCVVVECTSIKSCWFLYPGCEPLDMNCFGGNCCYMGGSPIPPGCPPRLCPEYN